MFKKKLIRNFDFVTLLLIMMITCFGLVGISVAMRSPVEGTEEGLLDVIENFDMYHVRLHLLWFAAGLIGMLIVVSIDYHMLVDLSPYMYWAVIGMLLYVAYKGHVAGNARSWIDFGSFYIQPSEFAKIALILTLAKVMAKKKDEGEGFLRVRDLFPVFLQLVIPMALIIDQPDFGTAMVFIVIVFGCCLLQV